MIISNFVYFSPLTSTKIRQRRESRNNKKEGKLGGSTRTQVSSYVQLFNQSQCRSKGRGYSYVHIWSQITGAEQVVVNEDVFAVVAIAPSFFKKFVITGGRGDTPLNIIYYFLDSLFSSS